MADPWKKVFCWSPECQKLVFKEDGSVNTDQYLYPDIDTEEITQFTCPRCGDVETWGVTRRNIAKTLYERSNNVRVGS